MALLTLKGFTARMFFRIGSRIHPTNDQLLCAWGLMESKHGHPHECVRLLTSAGMFPKHVVRHPYSGCESSERQTVHAVF